MQAKFWPNRHQIQFWIAVAKSTWPSKHYIFGPKWNSHVAKLVLQTGPQLNQAVPSRDEFGASFPCPSFLWLFLGVCLIEERPQICPRLFGGELLSDCSCRWRSPVTGLVSVSAISGTYARSGWNSVSWPAFNSNEPAFISGTRSPDSREI